MRKTKPPTVKVKCRVLPNAKVQRPAYRQPDLCDDRLVVSWFVCGANYILQRVYVKNEKKKTNIY